MAALAQCEMAMQKATNVYNMNLEEQENYTKLTTDIGKKTQNINEAITNSPTKCYENITIIIDAIDMFMLF